MNDSIGPSVKHMREVRGITQNDLATISGVARQTVASIENDSHDVKLSSLESVLDALGFDLRIVPKPNKPLSTKQPTDYEIMARAAVKELFSKG